MAEVRLTMDEYLALQRLVASERESEGTKLADSTKNKSLEGKKIRKVSKYGRTFGRMYRVERNKHPRMSHGQITKLAHKATRKALK